MVPDRPQPPQAPAAKLAAQVAHELNNPLDAVLRFVSLAQRKSQAGNYADVERHLADAQCGLERMAEILRQLMDLGRQTNDLLAAHAESGGARPLAALIAQALHTIAAQAEQKRVALLIDNGQPMDFAPRFDGRLVQVLANLLKNAVDAAPEGTTVRLGVVLASHCTLEMTVEDSGPGISSDLLPHLFTPFITTKGTGGGHGLGLAISRDLVTALQGTLAVQNRASPDHGCIATLILPVPLAT